MEISDIMNLNLNFFLENNIYKYKEDILEISDKAFKEFTLRDQLD